MDEPTMDQLIQLQRGDVAASILWQQGFNCFQLSVNARPLIWAPAGQETGNCHPACGGIPLLYPFPGRMAQATLAWEGETYQLEEGDGAGNAIHGFVFDRPWRLLDQTNDQAVAEFQLSRDAPDRLGRWPSDFKIMVTYQLLDGGISCAATVENCGERSMPSGFGAHPYFSLPAGDESLVMLPVTEQWELRELLPTGACSQLSEADADAFHQGRPFHELNLDAVFGGLTLAHGGSSEPSGPQYIAKVCGPSGAAGLSDNPQGVQLSFNPPLRELVVYTPSDRESICVEPLSCVPGGIKMGPDAGWTALEPGETCDFGFQIQAV